MRALQLRTQRSTLVGACAAIVDANCIADGLAALRRNCITYAQQGPSTAPSSPRRSRHRPSAIWTSPLTFVISLSRKASATRTAQHPLYTSYILPHTYTCMPKHIAKHTSLVCVCVCVCVSSMRRRGMPHTHTHTIYTDTNTHTCASAIRLKHNIPRTHTHIERHTHTQKKLSKFSTRYSCSLVAAAGAVVACERCMR